MGIRAKIFIVLVGTSLILGTVTFLMLRSSHDDLIEMEADRIASIVSSQVLADRAVYTKELVGKLNEDGVGAARDSHERTGFILLPAQFVRAVSLRVAATAGDLYRYALVSEWNLNQDQGLKDDFDRWAWTQLLAQDTEFRGLGAAPEGGYPWKPVSRIESVAGEPVLRYMRADPASAQSCVTCHNGYEQSADTKAQRDAQGVEVGKHWELDELMGAIRVEVPLTSVKAQAADSERALMISMGALFAVGFGTLLLVLYVSVTRPTEKSIGQVDEFKRLVETVVDRARELMSGTDDQFEALEDESGQPDLGLIRTIAMQNVSNAQLAAASCGELEEGFDALSGEMKKILGK